MQVVITSLLFVFSQLLGGILYAQHTDSGIHHGVLRTHTPAKDFVITSDGLIHKDFDRISVEGENDDLLFKKHVSRIKILFLFAITSSPHFIISNGLFFCQPPYHIGAARHIVHRVLRI